MDAHDLTELVLRGGESPGVEFKAGCSLSDKPRKAKIVKAVLAMANRRGGGLVLLGVEENDATVEVVGLTDDDLSTWSFDDVAGAIDAFADPHVDLSVEVIEHHSASVVVLHVREFEDVPVLCKKDYPGVLRTGACYVRRRGRIESSEIPNHAEMRALLELATEKRLRDLMGTIERAGVSVAARSQPNTVSKYDAQLEGFE